MDYFAHEAKYARLLDGASNDIPLISTMANEAPPGLHAYFATAIYYALLFSINIRYTDTQNQSVVMYRYKMA